MSKDRQGQPGALLSAEEIARNQAARNQESGNQNNDTPLNNTPPPESGAGEKSEPIIPSKMTVDQYLKRAPQSAGIGELVKSLYKTKITSYEDWEKTVKALLGKQVK